MVAKQGRPEASWVRQVVPAGYATGTIRMGGTSPLLMNCPDADQESALYRAYELLGQKKGKTQEEKASLRHMEWELRLYLDDDLGPYIPGRNVKALLWEAAGAFKRGATIKRSLITILSRIPLEYDGARDEAGLWAEGHRYTTMVQNAGYGSGRVLRCRPMFKDWTLTVDIAFDPDEIDADTLAAIVERSQRYGLGDYRPAKGGDFGAFAATLATSDVSRAVRKPLGSKARNGHEEQAHEAFKSRIMEPVT